MGIVDGSGQAGGQATLSGAGFYIAGVPGVTLDGSSLVGPGGVQMIFTGLTGGHGDVFWQQYTDGAGISYGLGSIVGSGVRVRTGSGRILARGDLVWSHPLPMHGTSSLVGFFIVEHPRRPPCPHCHRHEHDGCQCRHHHIKAICPGPKAFRYMETLQRGDLPVFISDHAGPVSPVRVVYTLYFVRPNGSRKQVGPSSRTPVPGVVGEYYATGRAGEMGQPGEWLIRWEFQKTFQSASQYKEMRFRVLDAALAHDPRDVTCRRHKLGWN
jgi:hypothetical protein